MGSELPRGPVRTGDLRRHLSRAQIAEHYRPVWRGVHVRRDVRQTFAVRSRALAVQHPGAVLVGWSAAQVWKHPWVPAAAVPSVATPTSRHALPGREFSRHVPSPARVRLVAGVPVADPVATAAELCRRLSFVEALVALDGLERAQPGTAGELARLRADFPRPRILGRIAAAVDGASPSREASWLRAQLVEAGMEGFRHGVAVPVRAAPAGPRVAASRAGSRERTVPRAGTPAARWCPLLAAPERRIALVEGPAPAVAGWTVVSLPPGLAGRGDAASVLVGRVAEVLAPGSPARLPDAQGSPRATAAAHALGGAGARAVDPRAGEGSLWAG